MNVLIMFRELRFFVVILCGLKLMLKVFFRYFISMREEMEFIIWLLISSVLFCSFLGCRGRFNFVRRYFWSWVLICVISLVMICFNMFGYWLKYLDKCCFVYKSIYILGICKGREVVFEGLKLFYILKGNGIE